MDCLRLCLLLICAYELADGQLRGIPTLYDHNHTQPLTRQFGEFDITWCTVNDAEHLKCSEFAQAVRQAREFNVNLNCKRAAFKDQCMNFLDNRQVDLVELDPGEMYFAGRYHSVVPIMSEIYGPNNEPGSYAVAVIHANSTINRLYDLIGRRACFSSVGDMAGWVVPLATLINEGAFLVSDCNNLVKSAAFFFGPSCAPNSLLDKHNPTGDNPQKMCELCAGRPGDRCSGNDRFAGYEGAFRCLEHAGEVAFLRHTTVDDATFNDGYRRYGYRLLCPFGGTESLDNYRQCNWGFVPSNVIATTSEALPKVRKLYQTFLADAVRVFGQDPMGTRFGDQRLASGSNNLLDERRDRDRMFAEESRRVPGSPNDVLSPDRYPFDTFNRTRRSAALFSPANNFFRGNTRRKARQIFSTPAPFIPPWQRNDQFFLFSRYMNQTNLMFQDRTVKMVPIEGNKQTFSGYLGEYEDVFRKLRKCPVPPAVLCVVSEKEMEKCMKMKTAFRSQTLKPDLHCVKRNSQLECMYMVRDGTADMVVLEAGDIYRAGQRFGLIPIIAEQYNLDEPYYYVVAVAQQKDNHTDMLYLKNKRSCHSAVNHAGGWIYPVSYLITNDRMRAYGCDSQRAASEFFSKACAPGALSPEFATDTTPDYKSYKNLCELCHGTGGHFCERDASEPFFGHTGAFRCLVEGGGDVAFVKHTTIFENTAGRNPMWWSRNVMPTDFELLCRDGSRARHDQFATCNLGRVAANAITTSADKPRNVIDAYIHLFVYAQQFYGSKYSEEFTFKMFVSTFDQRDLIFSDSTQQLKPVPEFKRNYRDYLGRDFLEAIKLVDCTAGSLTTAHVTLPLLLIAFLTAIFRLEAL